MSLTVTRRLENPNDSYYKRKYAEALLPVLDAMLVDRKQRSFSAKEHNSSLNSLFLRVNRSWLYIIDHMDEQGTYERLRKEVYISKDEQTGDVKLSFEKTKRRKADMEYPEPDRTYIASANVETPDSAWRENFDDFLENGEMGTEWELSKVLISEGGFDYMLSQVSMFRDCLRVVTLTRTLVKLVKVV